MWAHLSINQKQTETNVVCISKILGLVLYIGVIGLIVSVIESEMWLLLMDAADGGCICVFEWMKEMHMMYKTNRITEFTWGQPADIW